MIKKKVYYFAGLILIVTIVAYIAGHFFITKTTAYAVATNFVISNKKLHKKIGKIEKYRLSFFGYFLRFTGSKGEAEFKLSIKSEKSKGIVYINMEKLAGEWKIRKANFVYPDSSIFSFN